MFDFSQVLTLLKVEPGHGLLQSFLLFMIWMSSRGIKKEMAADRKLHAETKVTHETRFDKIEGRITALESVRGE